MKFIGAHVSASGGVFNAPLNAMEIGANAFALFTKNQKQWNSKPFDEHTLKLWFEALEKSNIQPKHILPHDSYLINLGNPNDEARQKSLDSFIDEVERCKILGLDRLNFHPGSHLRAISEYECLENISNCMNQTLQKTQDVMLIIENTAGQGSNLGYKFEHLQYLIENSIDKSRVGVCIDTCHLFTSGYDFRTQETYDATWKKFGEIVGFEYLKGMHLNDSKPDLGSKVDRHDSLGLGKLGLEPFRFIMNDKRMDDIPLILETVNPEIWANEIKLLRSMIIDE